MQMMIFINLIHLKKMSIMLLLHFQSSSLTIVFNDMSLDFICVVCTNDFILYLVLNYNCTNTQDRFSLNNMNLDCNVI